ncbi:Ephrin-A3, partial [Ataeniobius toweri]|nr:Ephrin-A3 [Ataeniobius toweri]
MCGLLLLEPICFKGFGNREGWRCRLQMQTSTHSDGISRDRPTQSDSRKGSKCGQKLEKTEDGIKCYRRCTNCCLTPETQICCYSAKTFSLQFEYFYLRREGYTMQVNVNDYLDIYCPHYNDTQRMVGNGEQYVLYMVSYRGYRNCDPQLGFKRWECNRPHAPHAPIKFSEKFQRYSAFSLGYEFHVGQEYYYISTPTHHHGRSCLRLRVYVCCSTASDVDDEPEPTEPDYTLSPGLKIDDI